MQSAFQCEKNIDELLASECAAGRILGPFERSYVPMVHLNRLGEVLKSTPGKCCLIVDLSYPSGGSANDGIAGSMCSLLYVSVESAARAVLRLGRGAHLAKMDIRDAYRNVPVHPDDRWLSGMSWRGSVFIDTVLPFGLHSAPKVFNTVADALERIVRKNGVARSYVTTWTTFWCWENLGPRGVHGTCQHWSSGRSGSASHWLWKRSRGH